MTREPPADWICERCGEEVLPICTGCPCCGLERPPARKELRAEVERLLDALKAIECHSIDHTDACRMAGKARAALERKP
jgi:hypothetical protein